MALLKVLWRTVKIMFFLGNSNIRSPRFLLVRSSRWLAMAIVMTLFALPTKTLSQTFYHPGVLINQAQLDSLKKFVAAGKQPWKDAYTEALASSFSSLSYVPRPFDTVDCGAFNVPNNGCTEETVDSKAAYSHALLWYLNGNKAHAQKAIQIMNAWSAVLKTHANTNAPLQAGWGATMFPRAAEIIRYTKAGWAQADIDRFSNMLRKAYLPNMWDGSPRSNGNWDLTMIEGMMGIGVFLDSVPVFDHAVTMWRQRVPAYFYMTTDGPYPPPSPGDTTMVNKDLIITYWQGQTTFKDGLSQETCRDFNHTQFGIASTINAAEIARLQGVDLYGSEEKRLITALEFHSNFMNGAAVPSWLCDGKLHLSTSPTWEIAYNHFHNRMNIALPNTLKLIGRIRPTGATATQWMMAWETLTHAETGGKAVLPMAPILTVGISPSRQVRPPVQGAKIVFMEGQGLLIQKTGKDGRHNWFTPAGKHFAAAVISAK